MKRILPIFFVLALVFDLAKAQNRQISGTIKDRGTGEALVGVSVTVKGTSNGTTTNVKGGYSISAPNSATLVFTFIGYKSYEVSVDGKTTINASLEEDAALLNEVSVVNIGYGTVKKKDLTGAVSSVSAETIAAAPVSSALEAIQGRAAGISITSTEGSPNADMVVRVRGGGSITQDNSPLYIVDGFPVASIADIAPQDIENIDILKDASSTAIYGSRGANGVVLVTTKSGKGNKTSISFNAFAGIRNLAKKLDVLTPADYVKFQYERALLANSLNDYTQFFGNYQDIDLYNNVPANDWQELVFGRTGATFNQTLSVNGGGEKTKYSLSYSYVKDKAIMQMSDNQRQNINFKLNHKLYKTLTLDFGLRYSDTKTNGGGTTEVIEVSSGDSRLRHAMLYPPFTVPGLTTTDATDDSFNLYNPLTSISDNDQYVHRKAYNINGAATYEPIKNLRLRSEIGYDGVRDQNNRFYGTTTYYVRNVPASTLQNMPALILTDKDDNRIRNTNTVNYSFADILDRDHNLTLLAGQEFLKTQINTNTTAIHGFPTTFTFDDAQRLTTQGTPNSVDNFFAPDYKLLSFFGRANYDYKGKYLVTATFRADGSSKFSEGNRWGYFPSASAAWRISAEPFMTDTKSWLDDLKVRFGYGAAGNDNIPTGQISQTFQNTITTWVNGYANFWAPTKVMANPDLKWETTVTRNLGVDFSFWKGQLTGTIDAYLNRTKDLLIQFPTAGTGYDSQFRNLGKTQNKGLEFSLTWGAVREKNFDLTINGNISFNRNKVIDIGGLQNQLFSSGWASTEINGDYLLEAGASLGRIYGFRSAGRYEVSDFSGYNTTTGTWSLNPGVADNSSIIGTLRPGSMKLQDLNGDGKVDLSDRTVIGNANPLNTGGFSLLTRIYNFDLGAYFNWSYGNDIYNANKIEYTSTSKYDSRNMIDIMADGNRWTNLRADGTISNDPTELQAMNANTTMWSPYMKSYALSDWAVEDGSFLRLSTLTLGYTLPQAISKKMKLQKLRVYASAYNLWLLTNYSGFDPEVSTRRRTNLTPGVDYSAYPRAKSFMFGLNVNF